MAALFNSRHRIHSDSASRFKKCHRQRLDALELENRVTPSIVGFPDPLFDLDGKQTFNLNTGLNDVGAAVAVQPDGKIVVVGSRQFGGDDNDFLVLRYNPDGTPDTTFNSGGLRIVAFDLGGNQDDQARAVGIQDDGSIVVAGYATTATNGRDFAIVRLTKTGELDNTFGTNGRVTFDISNGDDEAAAVAIPSNGKIVLAGYRTFSGADTDFTIARLKSDGSFDTSFNGSGKRIIAFDLDPGTNTDKANAVAVQSDGAIVAAGFARVNGQGMNIAAVRVLENGSIDGSFANNGQFTTAFSGSDRTDVANAVAIQSDGKVVLAGVGDDGALAPNNDTDFAFVRLTNTGALDSTFDGDGKLLVAFDNNRPNGTKNDGANALVIQPDGKIVAAGFVSFDKADSDFGFVRLNPDGSLDSTLPGRPSFDPAGGGRLTVFFDLGGADTDIAFGLALDPSGRFVAAGTATTDTNGTDIAISRIFGSDVPLVVSTLQDEADGDISNGKFSLREAIQLANLDPEDNAITFASGLSGTITLASDLPGITGNTTITGPGSSKLAISGNDVNRVFVVSDQSATLLNVSISGLTLTKGRATSSTGGAAPTLGGAIYAEENLILTDIAVTDNTVNGAIYNSTGTMTVTNGLFSGNQNNGSAAAILSDNAILNISNSTFTNNTGSNRGAIFTNKTATITNSTFTGNTATGAGGGGGAIFHRSGTLNVSGGTFASNTTNQNGGAIHTQEGTLTVTGSTFTGNKATSQGGALFNAADAKLTGVTVSGGTSGNGAGLANSGATAKLSVVNSTVSGNSGFAPGIRNDLGTVTVTGSTITGNTGNFDGGLSNFQGTMTVMNSTVSGNSVTDNGGGVVNSGTMTLTNVTITNNRTDSDGSGDTQAGGLTNLVAGTVTMTNTIVAGNLRGAIGSDVPSDIVDVGTTGKINVASSANNIIGDAGTAGGFSNNFDFGTNTGNIVGVAITDVLNPTLADNGGPTFTHALNPNGPAIGTGSKSAAPATDQRGFMRPADPTFFPDIGAVEPQLLTIAPSSLVNGTVGTPYNQMLTATLAGLPSGTTATFALDSGALPPGLTLSPAGLISGTPTASGTFSFGISATASTGDLALPTSFSITVPATEVLIGFPQFTAGSDVGGSTVTLFNPNGSLRFSVVPFPGFTGGVRTAAADFNNDGVADIIAGTGPGRATRVVVLDGVTQKQLFTVDPFEASFTGGVYVTAGDVNGDGIPDLAITPDEGGGPRVDMYSGNGFGKIVSFFGIDDVNFRGGARASIADLTGDGVGDLIVVAGFGGGPRVAAFDGPSLAKTPQKLFGDFFAFEQTLRNGIFVTAGDLNGDGFADLIAGGGPGGGPRVLVFDGKSLLSNQYVNLANFFGGDPNSRGGIRLAVKNLDGDARADLIVGSGTGAGSRVTAYLGSNIAPAGTPPSALDFDAFTGFVGGVFVG